MKKAMKVFAAVKIFTVVTLFSCLTLATTPGGSPGGNGGTSGSGPLGGSSPKVCGGPNDLGWIMLGAIIFFGLVGAIMFLLTRNFKTKSELSPVPQNPNQVQIVDSSGVARPAPLKTGSNSIGRDPGSDIQVNDPKVSKKHADLNVSSDGKYVLTDMGSQNGTFVNGTRIAQQELYQGDQIGIGDSRIIV